MIDLKLDVMEEDKPFSYEEFIHATNEYYEAMEDLTSAEQELFEVNRACENLVALQDIVAKHGWSAILNELVGNQISSESLDVSCEGALDKIKQIASKVGSKLANALQKSFNLFDIYVRRFKAAKEWLKKNKTKSNSTEAFIGNRIPTDVKDHLYIKLHRCASFYENNLGKYVTSGNAQSIKDRVIEQLVSGGFGYDLRVCTNEELIEFCDDAITNIPRIKGMLEVLSDFSRQKRNDINNLKKEATSTPSSTYRAFLSRLNQENIDAKRASILNKLALHVSLMCCKHLDAEISKRMRFDKRLHRLPEQ